jgi:hypothetical protein
MRKKQRERERERERKLIKLTSLVRHMDRYEKKYIKI